jgi:CelD/BcsL family acetyltransferase involved in cellulose biosynthesis
MPQSQAAFAACGSIESVAPYADLSAGYDMFHRACRDASSRELPVAAQKLRKAVREWGPVEFEYRSSNRAALQAMLDWKLAQCRANVCYCPFAEAWARPFFDRLLDHQDPAFRGILSTISFGGTLAAVLLSLQSGSALHGSVIAYNPALGRYSPGLQLLLKVTEAAARDGISRFDFGKGNDRYKRCLANAAVTVFEGCADNRPLTAAVWRAGIRVRDYLRSSSLRPIFSRVRMLTTFSRS